jgi:glc operon protein GlcG
MPLTNEIAQQMINASQDKARELGVAVATAIVDAEGRLIAFSRMDGVHWLSIDVAQAKAFTGALLRREGAELQQMDPILLARLSTLQNRGLMPARSVTILREGDQLLASVGCSGGTDEQDGECAQAARNTYPW